LLRQAGWRILRDDIAAVVPRKATGYTIVEETLWPEFEKLSATLRTFLDDITERVIRESIHADDSEAEEVAEPPALASTR
jgi:hypothetical protein